MTTKHKTTMKQGLLGFAILFFISCAGPQDDLTKLNIELDSLKQVKSDIEKEILLVEGKIDQLDTNIEYTLVTTYKPTQEVFKHYFEVYGTIQSDYAATVYAESAGVIQDIRVNEGQEVSKGQIIAKQDDEIIKKNINELETQLDLANTLYEKQKRLWEQNVGSEIQYLEAKNRKESLESSLATLREQQKKATVRAPFAGVVDKIYPKVGELAGMSSPIVRLVNLDELYITADVSERYLGFIAKGDQVNIIVNRKDTVKSTISRIGKYVKPTNRSFEIRVDMKGTNEFLRPNSLVVLQINDLTEDDAVIVPSSMIMQDGQGDDYVFVVNKEDDKMIAKKRPIQVGISYMGNTVVKEGLKATDTLIDKGSRSVRDGDRVEETTI